jgi:glycosyltransferase involved in cell wall biosynthesis
MESYAAFVEYRVKPDGRKPQLGLVNAGPFLKNAGKRKNATMTAAYSVIIPAYNEEQLLGQNLSALKKAMDAVDLPGEVIVVDNRSSDRTAEIANQYEAQVVFEPIHQISRARNTGARIASGKYFIFLDADTLLSAELLQLVLAKLTGGACCGGGALVAFDKPIPWYFRWIPAVWNHLSTRYGLAAGCFMYCLREGFEEVGGFNEKVYASEEIWFSRSLSRWGKLRNLSLEIIARPSVITSSRKMQDYPVRNLLAFCFVLAFPLAVRFRSLSRLWYYR